MAIENCRGSSMAAKCWLGCWLGCWKDQERMTFGTRYEQFCRYGFDEIVGPRGPVLRMGACELPDDLAIERSRPQYRNGYPEPITNQSLRLNESTSPHIYGMKR